MRWTHTAPPCWPQFRPTQPFSTRPCGASCCTSAPTFRVSAATCTQNARKSGSWQSRSASEQRLKRSFPPSWHLRRGTRHTIIKRDFNRFGFLLNLQAHPAGPPQVTDLGHLNDWRNKAAHQGSQPLGGGVPPVLTLPIVQGWRASCAGLAASLDDIMRAELLRMMGVAPW